MSKVNRSRMRGLSSRARAARDRADRRAILRERNSDFF